MYHYLISFGIHFISYWYLVYLYDDFKIKDYDISVKNSLINQFVITLPTTYFFLEHYTINYNDLFLSLIILPILIICSDIYFYILHRILHHRYFWHFHKAHHKGELFIAKSLDSDIFEHLFVNLGSFVIGLLVFSYFHIYLNIYIFHLFVGIGTINTCISHSDKKHPCDNGLHQIHHKKLVYNYGFYPNIMDIFFNTFSN